MKFKTWLILAMLTAALSIASIALAQDSNSASCADADNCIVLEATANTGTVEVGDATTMVFRFDGFEIHFDILFDAPGEANCVFSYCVTYLDGGLVMWSAESDGTEILAVELWDFSEDDDGLVTVCHFPPEDVGNEHTITISEEDLQEHLDHDDFVGSCGEDEDGEKVTICHIPPGNPENEHTISIDVEDLQDHLDHGDFEGPCEEGQDTDTGDDDESEGGHVTICHIPPGNPDNAHTITIGEAAVPAHLAHGDTLGPCPDTPAAESQAGGQGNGRGNGNGGGNGNGNGNGRGNGGGNGNGNGRGNR